MCTSSNIILQSPVKHFVTNPRQVSSHVTLAAPKPLAPNQTSAAGNLPVSVGQHVTSLSGVNAMPSTTVTHFEQNTNFSALKDVTLGCGMVDLNISGASHQNLMSIAPQLSASVSMKNYKINLVELFF